MLVGTLAAVRRAVWLVTQNARGSARSCARSPKIPSWPSCSASTPQVVYLRVFVFECAAVALGAALVAPRSPILTSMGFDEVILTFVVVVLGGIGSVGGSLLAGFGLGLFTALFGALVSPAYTTAAAFRCCWRFSLLRPRGLGCAMTVIESHSRPLAMLLSAAISS